MRWIDVLITQAFESPRFCHISVSLRFSHRAKLRGTNAARDHVELRPSPTPSGQSMLRLDAFAYSGPRRTVWFHRASGVSVKARVSDMQLVIQAV